MKWKRLAIFLLMATGSCHNNPKQQNNAAKLPDTSIQTKLAVTKQKAITCESGIPARFASTAPAPATTSSALPNGSANSIHPNMIWIPGGTFSMGGDNKEAQPDEYPKHTVTVSGFWMDKTEVTNAQFAAFVKATNYITTAEKKPDWNELKKQLPPGTEKPDESLLVPASLVFSPPDHPIELNDYSQWWAW